MSLIAETQNHLVDSVAGTPYAVRLLEMPGVWPSGPSGEAGLLADGISGLFAQQTQTWEDTAERVGHLDELLTRPIRVEEALYTAQFNPARVRNTGSFKREEVAKRACFLDAENFPEPEMGIAVAGLFAAVNPYPILPRHLTIIKPEHVDQALDPMLESMYHIADRFGASDPGYFVFYNGPEVGASAPDHAHLQAGRLPVLPIEANLAKLGPGEELFRDGDLTLSVPKRLGRTAILLESRDTAQTIDVVRRILGSLATPKGSVEPKLNMIVRRTGGGALRTFIFPREDFRPRIFYDAEGGVKLSPASLEMAGILVVPTQEDFDALAPDNIREAFLDVSPSREAIIDQLQPLSA